MKTPANWSENSILASDMENKLLALFCHPSSAMMIRMLVKEAQLRMRTLGIISAQHIITLQWISYTYFAFVHNENFHFFIMKFNEFIISSLYKIFCYCISIEFYGKIRSDYNLLVKYLFRIILVYDILMLFYVDMLKWMKIQSKYRMEEDKQKLLF